MKVPSRVFCRGALSLRLVLVSFSFLGAAALGEPVAARPIYVVLQGNMAAASFNGVFGQVVGFGKVYNDYFPPQIGTMADQVSFDDLSAIEMGHVGQTPPDHENDGFWTRIQARSSADISGLHAFSEADLLTVENKFLVQAGATSVASETFDDLVIRGPPGIIGTSFFMKLTGRGELSARSSSASGTVAINLSSGGTEIGYGDKGASLTSNIFGTSQNRYFHGFLNAATDLNNIQSPLFDVQANVPFTLTIRLETDSTVAGGAESFLANSKNDFSDTLSFVSGSPVFDLPPGYTADSAEAGIVNNRFLFGETTATTPEPCSLALISTALATLVLRRVKCSATGVTRHAADAHPVAVRPCGRCLPPRGE